MSEINVTPMVDVMLVLLIIFMVARRCCTVGVPIELPEAKGQADLDTEQGAARRHGQTRWRRLYRRNTGWRSTILRQSSRRLPRTAMTSTIFVRGDKGVSYGVVMKVMGRINDGGFKKLSFVLDQEKGGS